MEYDYYSLRVPWCLVSIDGKKLLNMATTTDPWDNLLDQSQSWENENYSLPDEEDVRSIGSNINNFDYSRVPYHYRLASNK